MPLYHYEPCLMTPKAFAEEMAQIQNSYPKFTDTDERHMKMDEAMCKLLRSLGYGEGVEIFEKSEKWYE